MIRGLGWWIGLTGSIIILVATSYFIIIGLKYVFRKLKGIWQKKKLKLYRAKRDKPIPLGDGKTLIGKDKKVLNKTHLIILWIMAITISMVILYSGIKTDRESIYYLQRYFKPNWTVYSRVYSRYLAVNWFRVLALPVLITGSLMIITLWKK